MAKIVISYPFTGNFFQTENTKCRIFDQNRLIACQTQEKNQINHETSQRKKPINRKFRVPRKQGAHFLGARAQIQDSLVFHHQHEISDR
jgi:hypothetical protein